MDLKSNTFEKENLNHHDIVKPSPATIENNIEKSQLQVLSYAGLKRDKLTTSLKKSFKINFPGNLVTKSAFSANRLRDRFTLKHTKKKEHQHDVIYYAQCHEDTRLYW